MKPEEGDGHGLFSCMNDHEQTRHCWNSYLNKEFESPCFISINRNKVQSPLPGLSCLILTATPRAIVISLSQTGQ